MFGDCAGCRKRRETMLATGRKMAEWLKHPFGPPPLDITQAPQLPDQRIERLALILFLSENPGASESDWRNATGELRHNYRVAVLAKMEQTS